MPTFDSIDIGLELEPITKTLGREDLVRFAAASGDFNPFHYDADHPQVVALGDNAVHGRLKFATLGQLVAQWLDHSGWVRSISCQYRGMDFRNRAFTARGKVTGKAIDDRGRRVVDLDVWVENEEGIVTTPGQASVILDG